MTYRGYSTKMSRSYIRTALRRQINADARHRCGYPARCNPVDCEIQPCSPRGELSHPLPAVP